MIEPPARRFLMNRAGRDMLVSDFTFVWQCGYARKPMADRTELVDRLYREGGIGPEESAILHSLGRPVFVFYQGDEGGLRSPLLAVSLSRFSVRERRRSTAGEEMMESRESRNPGAMRIVETGRRRTAKGSAPIGRGRHTREWRHAGLRGTSRLQ